MDFNGAPILGQQELSVPPLTIRMEKVGFRFTLSEDGENGTIQILYPHPILPVVFEIPFNQMFYMEQYLGQVEAWVNEAKTRQETSA